MGEKSKKPAIRFSGFCDDWEQRKVGEITKTNAFKQYISDAVEDGEFEVIQQGDRPVAGYADGNPFTEFANVALFGDHTLSLFKPRRPFFVASDGIKILSPSIEMCGVYYYYLLEKYKPQSEGYKRHFTILKECESAFPKNIKEQEKIGEYFANLDQTITLHQRKYEKLLNVKKAMLEKMFPQNGAKVPEIRFAGFTDDWEQRKLGELTSEFQSGKFIAAADIEESGEYPVYGGNGLRGYADRYNHDGDFALIGRQGALCGNVNKSSGKAYFTEHAVAVKANDDNDTDFLFHMLGRMNLGKYSDQSAQPGLAVGKLVALSAMVPKLGEQEKISGYFSSIDKLITLHQRKLEKLQNIKKSCLEKMFV